jgi:hypothetical protein
MKKRLLYINAIQKQAPLVPVFEDKNKRKPQKVVKFC